MILEFLICYLIGTLSPGYILAKKLCNLDLRYCGSGSTGATNALRCTKNKYIALITLLIDLSKGATIALIFKDSPYCFIYCFAGLLGHVYPVWLKFHGGKGVSTSAGMFLAIEPLCALIAIVAWLLALVFIKISAVASLTMSFTFLLSTILLSGKTNILLFSLLTFIFLVWTHRYNLRNLLSACHK